MTAKNIIYPSRVAIKAVSILQFLRNFYASVVTFAVKVNVITALLARCGAFSYNGDISADGFEGVFDGSFVCHIV